MTIANALNELSIGLVSIFGSLINSIILYGSVARGTNGEDSDIDIALIMNSAGTSEMHAEMLDLIVDLELSCGKMLSVVQIDQKRFAEWHNLLPFYMNIQKEGVVLWQAA